MHYVNAFLKSFNKPRVNFFRDRRQTQLIWNSGNIIENVAQNNLRKLRKCINLAYFSKDLTNGVSFFWAFREKAQLLEIVKKFPKNFLRKFAINASVYHIFPKI